MPPGARLRRESSAPLLHLDAGHGVLTHDAPMAGVPYDGLTLDTWTAVTGQVFTADISGDVGSRVDYRDEPMQVVRHRSGGPALPMAGPCPFSGRAEGAIAAQVTANTVAADRGRIWGSRHADGSGWALVREADGLATVETYAPGGAVSHSATSTDTIFGRLAVASASAESVDGGTNTRITLVLAAGADHDRLELDRVRLSGVPHLTDTYTVVGVNRSGSVVLVIAGDVAAPSAGEIDDGVTLDHVGTTEFWGSFNINSPTSSTRADQDRTIGLRMEWWASGRVRVTARERTILDETVPGLVLGPAEGAVFSLGADADTPAWPVAIRRLKGFGAALAAEAIADLDLEMGVYVSRSWELGPASVHVELDEYPGRPDLDGGTLYRRDVLRCPTLIAFRDPATGEFLAGTTSPALGQHAYAATTYQCSRSVGDGEQTTPAEADIEVTVWSPSTAVDQGGTTVRPAGPRLLCHAAVARVRSLPVLGPDDEPLPGWTPHYLDTTGGGSDSNDGTTKALTRLTVDQAWLDAFPPYSMVRLRRGGTYAANGTTHFLLLARGLGGDAYGAAAGPLLVCGYGAGANPLITGRVRSASLVDQGPRTVYDLRLLGLDFTATAIQLYAPTHRKLLVLGCQLSQDGGTSQQLFDLGQGSRLRTCLITKSRFVTPVGGNYCFYIQQSFQRLAITDCIIDGRNSSSTHVMRTSFGERLEVAQVYRTVDEDPANGFSWTFRQNTTRWVMAQVATKGVNVTMNAQIPETVSATMVQLQQSDVKAVLMQAQARSHVEGVRSREAIGPVGSADNGRDLRLDLRGLANRLGTSATNGVGFGYWPTSGGHHGQRIVAGSDYGALDVPTLEAERRGSDVVLRAGAPAQGGQGTAYHVFSRRPAGSAVWEPIPGYTFTLCVDKGSTVACDYRVEAVDEALNRAESRVVRVPAASGSVDDLPGKVLLLEPAGLVPSSGAALFDASTSNYLGRAEADSRALSFGPVDWWVACWFYPTTSGAFQMLVARYDAGAANAREWRVGLNSSDQPIVSASSDGTAFTTATLGTAASAGAWNFLMACHRQGSGLDLRLNGGDWATTAYTAGVATNLARLLVGANDSAGSPTQPFGGRIDQVTCGASPPGGLLGVRDAIFEALYDGGAGVPYSGLSSAQKTAWGLVEAWELDESTGTRLAAHGGNDLTMTGTVGSAAGLVVDPATAGSWTDLAWGSGLSRVSGAPAPAIADDGSVALDGLATLGRPGARHGRAPAFTVLARVRLDSTPTDPAVIWEEGSSDGGAAVALRLAIGSDRTVRASYRPSGGTLATATSGGAVPLGQYAWVGLRRDGTTLEAFVVGSGAKGSVTVDAGYAMPSATSRLGGPVASSGFVGLVGRVGQVVGCHRALSDAEIAGLGA